MLDFYFKSAVRLRQLRRGPLDAHLDGFAAALRRDAYSAHTARRILSIAGQFSGYAGLAGIAAPRLDEAVAERFLASALVGDGLCLDGPKVMRQLLDYLRQQGIVTPSPMGSPPGCPPRAVRRAVIGTAATGRTSPTFAPTLAGLDDYLRDVRGLAPTTRAQYQAQARALLDALHTRYDDQALQRVAGHDVLDFVSAAVGRLQSRSARAHRCSHVRGILRYLHAAGLVAVDLSRAVPHVATVRLASLPPRLPWAQVRALIDGVDGRHPDGLRDKAILLLLATLGLRGCEVRALELGHIDWRAGALRLARTKTQRERVLPLLPEIGATLADYVLHGRPVVTVPQVFLSRPPRPQPLKANTIVWMVRRHLRQAGIHVARGGAHMLRHSLATRMVTAGVSIKAIADVLGHASIDTTAIYTKVDTSALSAVALPFPGGAQ
jgi:site-specific recombinase XerD